MTKTLWLLLILGIGGVLFSPETQGQRIPILISRFDLPETGDSCKALFEMIAVVDHRQQGDTLVDLEPTLLYLESLLANNSLTVREQTAVNAGIAYILVRLKRLQAAFPYLKQADKLAQELPVEDPIKGFAHGSFGSYLLFFAVPELAIRPLKDGINSLQYSDIRGGYVHRFLYNNLINASLGINKIDSVRVYLQELIFLSEQIDPKGQTASYCNNSGLALASSGYHNDALEVFQKGLDLLDTSIQIQLLTYVNLTESMAHTLVVKGDSTEAMRHLYHTYAVRKKLAREKLSLQVMGYILKYHIAQGQHETALAFFKKEEAYFETYASINRITYKLYAQLAALFRLFGDEEKAWTYESLYNEYLAEKLLPLEEARKPPTSLNSFIDLRNKSYEQQQRITSLEKDQLQQDLRTRTITILGLVALFIVFCVGIFFYRKISKERERLLAQRNDNLKTLQAFKQRMTSMIVHDLKGPLQVVYSRSQPDQGGDTAINSASKRMLMMVQNLLDVDKAEQTELSLSLETLSLKQLILGSRERLHHLSEEKDLQIDIHIPVAFQVFTDRGLTERALDNVLNNAIKFSQHGGTIVFKSKQEGEFIQLSVIDQGAGIPEAIREEVFSDYISFDAGTTTHGLGLSFTQLVMDKIGGAIQVVDNELPGAHFRLDFPDANSVNRTKLTGEEADRIAVISAQLASIPIYQISEIKAVLDNLDNDSPGLLAWKQNVLHLAYTGDEEAYRLKLEV